MELLEVYRCPLFNRVVFTARFKNVKNAGDVRARIVAAAGKDGREGERAREAVDFAFINARLITSALHLQTAAVQALVAESAKSMRTKTVHSEVIWFLNPTNSITDGIRRYGISDTTTDLVVMHIASSERDDILERMCAVVDGELDPVAHVAQHTDWATVIKHYKLDQEPAFDGCTGHSAEERARIDRVVVSAVAIKSIMQ